jgi:hypothetical protein
VFAILSRSVFWHILAQLRQQLQQR